MNSLAEILRRKRTKQIGLVCVSALLSISLLELILAPMLLPGMKGRSRTVALTGVAADPGIVLDGARSTMMVSLASPLRISTKDRTPYVSLRLEPL